MFVEGVSRGPNFNNLNGDGYYDGDIYILIFIFIFNRKVRNSLYLYLYSVNMRISRQNRNGFGQYPWDGFICHL